jgi:anti-anti-sigma factor
MFGLNREITKTVRRDRRPAPDTAFGQLEVDGLVWAPGGQRWIYEVTLTGALDLAGAPLLGAVLRESIAGGARDIHLDLAAVSFIDTAGLGTLVATQAQLAELGGRLYLRAPSWPVRRLVCIADLCAHLELDSTQDPCQHNDTGTQHGSGGSRYPAAGPIAPDQPLRITGIHVTGVHTASVPAA